MEVDSKLVTAGLVILAASTILTSYVIIEKQSIQIPKSFLLPHKKILAENKHIWNSDQLEVAIQRDSHRSSYTQDGFVVDFPILDHKSLSGELIKQIKWLCTQSIAQDGFISIHHFFQKKYPNIVLIQSSHKREIRLKDYCMEYLFCCDLMDNNNEMNNIGHLCHVINIFWNEQEIVKIEIQTKFMDKCL